MAEQRLIDANALNLRDRVITDMGGMCFIEDVETAIEEIPTIDAVPVVRCQYCKHFRRNEMDDTYCDCVGGLTGPEEHDFCSYGERKDDGICKED